MPRGWMIISLAVLVGLSACAPPVESRFGTSEPRLKFDREQQGDPTGDEDENRRF